MRLFRNNFLAARIAPMQAACAALALAIQTLSAAPRLVCDKPQHDFGLLTVETNVVHRFTLRNEGDAPLKILEVKSGCACATTEVSRATLGPKETAELMVELDLHGRLGTQEHAVWVVSNDPATNRLQLECVGEVRLDVEVRPQMVFWQYVPGDKDAREELVVTGGNSNRFAVLGVETGEVPFCDVALKTVRPESEYRIEVAPKAEAMKLGRRLEGKLWIKTDQPRYARVAVPVIVAVEKDLLAIPGELNVKALTPGEQPGVVSVLVRSRRRNAFTIRRIDPPRPEVQVETASRGLDYVLRISNLRGSKELDGQKIRVLLKKANGEEDLLEIPVRVK